MAEPDNESTVEVEETTNNIEEKYLVVCIFHYIIVGICACITVLLLWSLITYGATLVFANYYFESEFITYYSYTKSSYLYTSGYQLEWRSGFSTSDYYNMFDYNILEYFLDFISIIIAIVGIIIVLGILWFIIFVCVGGKWFLKNRINKQEEMELEMDIYITNIIFVSSIISSVIIGSILFVCLCFVLGGVPTSAMDDTYSMFSIMLNFIIILSLGMGIILPIMGIAAIFKWLHHYNFI